MSEDKSHFSSYWVNMLALIYLSLAVALGSHTLFTQNPPCVKCEFVEVNMREAYKYINSKNRHLPYKRIDFLEHRIERSLTRT